MEKFFGRIIFGSFLGGGFLGGINKELMFLSRFWGNFVSMHSTEVRFTSFFSGGFITAIVVNPPERKLAKRTSVHCGPKFIYLVQNTVQT